MLFLVVHAGHKMNILHTNILTCQFNLKLRLIIFTRM